MKKLLAWPLVIGCAGSAWAQSSVTIYGKIDQGVGKPIGSATKQVFDAGGIRTSRIGFRGKEDIGNGMAAVFTLEHRFTADSGVSTAPIFWQGESNVGLATPLGKLTLGRQFTPSFSLIQNLIDPWNGETVAALRTVAMQGPQTGRIGAPAGPVAPARARFASSVRYDYTGSSGLNFAAAVGQPGVTNNGPDRSVSIAANYTTGPWFVGAGYENASDPQDRLWNLGARYTFADATIRAGFSKGKTAGPLPAASSDVRAWMVAATMRFGINNIRAGYGTSRVSNPFAPGAGGDAEVAQKFSLGYEYNFSKRTKLYADVAHDRRAVFERTGYDVGIQHNF